MANIYIKLSLFSKFTGILLYLIVYSIFILVKANGHREDYYLHLKYSY